MIRTPIGLVRLASVVALLVGDVGSSRGLSNLGIRCFGVALDILGHPNLYVYDTQLVNQVSYGYFHFKSSQV